MIKKYFTHLLFFLPFFASCQPKTNEAEFAKYWYAGKAEVSSYDLQQARYGEMRQGEAILIFVTEDFSKSKQVKIDNPQKNPNDAVKILKLNLTKKFNTGLYEYSLMQSIFSPIDRNQHEYTFKVSSSAQDWCGHVFSQLNLQTYKYRFLQHSYFENEYDQEFILEKELLEDELLTLIRINPKLLPLGNINIIPNSLTARLRHTNLAVEDAEATLNNKDDISVYKIVYKNGNRSVEIEFKTDFPHQIEAFSETYPENGQMLTTTARRRKTILSDYWTKNGNADAVLRKELGLK
jgi:hypothetical protein